MSDAATIFRRLAALGLNTDQIGGVLDIMAEKDAAVAAADDERKAQVRARVQKWRSKNKEETLRNVTDRNGDATKRLVHEDVRVEDNLLPKKISGQEENKQDDAPKARVSDLAEFKAELSELDAARLEAIIKHRRAKRGQLTGHAAALFRRDAADCNLSLVEAVDACISRNWITVKPEYFAGRSRPNSTAPPGNRSVSDVLGEIAAGTWNPPGPSHEPEYLPSIRSRN